MAIAKIQAGFTTSSETTEAPAESIDPNSISVTLTPTGVTLSTLENCPESTLQSSCSIPQTDLETSLVKPPEPAQEEALVNTTDFDAHQTPGVADPARQESAQALLAMTSVTVHRHSASIESFYLWSNKKADNGFPADPFYTTTTSMSDRFSHSNNWEEAVKTLRDAQTKIKWKDISKPTLTLGANQAALNKLSCVEDYFGCYSYVERLEMIFASLSTLKDGYVHKAKNWTVFSCSRNPFICHCELHEKYQKIFIHSSLVLLSGLYIQFSTQCTHSQLLKDLEKCSQKAEYWLIQRMLPLICDQSEDLGGMADRYLQELVVPTTTGKRSAAWYFKAQITLRRLKRGDHPQTQPGRQSLSKFLDLYLQHGEHLLRGESQRDYQAEFLACCKSLSLSQQNYQVDWKALCRTFLEKSCEYGVHPLAKAVFLWQTTVESEAPQDLFAVIPEELSKCLIQNQISFETFWERLGSTCSQTSKGLLELMLLQCHFEPNLIMEEKQHNSLYFWLGLAAFCDKNSSAFSISTGEAHKRLSEAYCYFNRDLQAESFFTLRAELDRRVLIAQFFSQAKSISAWFAGKYNHQELEDHFASSEAEIKRLQELNAKLDKLNDLSSKKPYEVLSSEATQTWRSKLKNEKQLIVKDLRTFQISINKDFKHIFTAYDLLDLSFYRTMFSKKSKDKSASFQVLEARCRDLESEIRQLFNNSALDKINEEKLISLETFFKDSDGVQKVSEAFQISEAVKAVRKNYRLIKLLKNFELIKPGLEEILAKLLFVKDKGSDIKKLSQLSNLYARGELDTRSIANTIGDRDSIDRIVKSLCRSETWQFAHNLSNVCAIFEEFESKNDTHFQNLLTCKAMRTSDINLNSIKELERFMKAFAGSPPGISLVDFLESMTRPASSTDTSKFNVVEVMMRSQSLIRISKNISDNLERGSNQMRCILQNSVVLFSLISQPKSVSVVAKYREEAAQEDIRHDAVELVPLDSMKAIKIQMALFESAKAQSESTNKAPNESLQQQISWSSVFIQLVEHIEAIQAFLQGLFELGLVYDLESQIKTELPELEDLVDEYRSKSQNDQEQARVRNYHRSLHKLAFGEMLSMEVPIKADSATSCPDISPFLVLRVLLGHHYTVQKQKLISPGLAFHPLTRLTGPQKMLLCQWIQLKADPQSQTLANLESQVSAITKFAFDNDFTSQKLSRYDWAKLVERRSGDTTTVLESVFGALIQKTTGVVPRDLAADDPLGAKSLYYYATRPSQTFSGLLQVLLGQQRTFGTTAQPALQFMLANPETSAAELLLFLLRAAQDPDQNFYYMVDLHLVKLEVADQFFTDLQAVFFTKSVSVKNKHLMLLLSSDAKQNELLLNLMRHSSQFRNFRVEMPEVDSQKVNMEAARKVFPGLKMIIVESDIAGMGKSVYIKQQVAGIHSIINLSGDISKEGIMKRLAIVQDSLQSNSGEQNEKKELITLQFILDMVENFEENCEIIDQYLFKLAFLKKFDYQDSIIGLQEIDQVYLELQNTCKSTYMKRVSVLGLLAQGENHIRLESVASADHLKRIMDFGKLSTAEQSKAKLLGCLIKNIDKFAKYACEDHNGDVSKIFNTFCQQSGGEASKEIFIDSLVDLVQNKCKRPIKNTSMSQVVSFISMAYFQIEEFCRLGVLDLAATDKSEKPDVMRLRLVMLEKILSDTVALLWQDSDSIRDETRKAQQLMQANDGDQEKQQLLEQYKQRMNKIRDWRDSKMVSYFILNYVLKLIYCNLSDVSNIVQQTIIRLDETWDKRKLEDEVIVPFNPFRPGSARKIQLDEKKATTFFVQLFEVLCPRGSKEAKREEISKFRNGFTFTQDIYVKILMIVQRAYQRIPIVIMGPTGCGKTYLVTFTAKCLLGDEFRILTLHPGITEDRLKIVLFKIQELAIQMTEGKRLWVLFDEFNTSHLQSLVAEIISTRKANFHKDLRKLVFADNIVFVACCNPFKIEPAKYNQVGLLNQSKASLLAHRVYPIPDTLIPFVWRFSSIQNDDEKKHIELKLDSVRIPPRWRAIEQLHNSLKQSAEVCHRFHRENGSENTISLRDLTRFKEIYEFLTTHFFRTNQSLLKTAEEDGDVKHFTEYDGLIVATEYCYVIRLETYEEREVLRKKLIGIPGLEDIKLRFDTILNMLQKELSQLENLKDLLQRAVLNRPLLENIFVLWICLINRIPVLICGKPGTSKTLSISITFAAFASNQVTTTELSKLLFFNQNWSLTQENFWGTETTTAESVETAFEAVEETYRSLTKVQASQGGSSARTASANAPTQKQPAVFDDDEPNRQIEQDSQTQSMAEPENSANMHRVALVFDELGLAENSKDNPLKALHSKLEPPERTISFVGASNWKLDASKQNRMLYVARPDMSIEDLVSTCSIRFQHYHRGKQTRPDAKAARYAKFEKALEPYFRALAVVYEKFRKQQESSKNGHANFHGSRDFYSVVGILEHSLRSLLDIWDDPEQLELPEKERFYLLMRNAIQRSFSGQDESLPGCETPIIELYERQLDPKYQGTFVQGTIQSLNCMDLILQNLLDTQARHLMIFTETSGIQEIILQKIRAFQSDVQGLSENKFVFLSQTKGRDEMIKVMMTQLPIYTREGFTVVMKDIQDVYGCMYELLNKNYVKSDAKGMNQCKLFYENNHQLIDVDDRFKLILLMDRVDPNMEQKELEKLLPPPFLNRFEKYYVGNREFMDSAQHAEYLRLREQCYPKKPTKFSPEMNRLIFNLSDELLISAVVNFNVVLPKGAASRTGDLEESEIDWQQSVLSYLTNYASWDASSSRGLNKGKTHFGGKVVSASEQALEKLFPLFNKNMILALFLCQNNCTPLGLNIEDIDDIRKQFLDSHPFDNLSQLVEAMSPPQSKLQKVVVFTFSTRLEVEESVKALTKDSLRVDLQDAYSLHKKINLSQGEVVSEIAADKGSLLLVDFRDTESRKLMQHLRYWLNKALGSAEKKVIFIVNVSNDDMAPGSLHQSPISYSTIGWTMQSIDNLKGSCYAEFFDLLQKPYKESFQSANKAVFGQNPRSTLLKQIITDSLRKLFFKMLSFKEDNPEFTEFNNLLETISNRTAIVAYFISVLENEVKDSDEPEDAVFSSNLRPDKLDVRSYFRSHHNMECKVTEVFKQELIDILQRVVQEPANLRGLHRILALPAEIQENCLIRVDRLFTRPFTQFTERQTGLFDAAVALEFVKQKFDLKFKSVIEDMKSKVLDNYQGMLEASSHVDKKLTELLYSAELKHCFKDPNSSTPQVTDMMQMEDSTSDVSSDNGIEFTYLCGLLTFEKFEKTQPTTFSKEVRNLIMLSAHEYLKEKSIAITKISISACMIIISKVFHEELQALAICLSGQTSTSVKTLIEQGAFSLAKKCSFELDKYLNKLFKIEQLYSKAGLEQFKQQIMAGITFCKRLPKLMKSSQKASSRSNKHLLLQHEFLYSTLDWISSIEDEVTSKNILNKFNVAQSQTDLHNPQGITLMLLRFQDALVELKSSEVEATSLLLIDTSVHYCMQVLDQNSEAACLRLFCQSLCRRVVANSTGPKKIQECVVTLAKIIVRLFSNPHLAEELSSLIEAQLKPPSSDVLFELNFHMVTCTGDIPHSSNDKSLAHRFLKSGIIEFQKMIGSELSNKILTSAQVVAIRQFKQLFADWQNDASYKRDTDPLEKSVLDELVLRYLKSDAQSVDYQFGLLFCQMLYDVIRNQILERRQTGIGLVGIQEKLESMMQDPSMEILFPDTQKMKGIVRLQDFDKVAVTQTTFVQKLMCLPVISPSYTSIKQRTSAVEYLSRQNARFGRFISTLTQESKQRELQLRDKKAYNLHLLVSMAALVAQEAPPSFVYSQSNLTESMKPIINMEPPVVVSMLEALDDKLQNSKSWTKAWRCQSPNCAFITTLRNCGRWGFHHEDNTSFSLCPGPCKKEIGRYAKDGQGKEFTELPFEDMKRERDALLREDTVHMKVETFDPDPERYFREMAYRAKYSKEFGHGDDCRLAYVIQHCFGLAQKIYDRRLTEIPFPLDQNLMLLLSRDIEFVAAKLRRDLDTTVLYFLILFESMLTEMKSDPAKYDDFSKFRLRIVEHGRKTEKEFPKIVNEYHEFRVQIGDLSSREILKLQNFIARNFSASTPKKEFPNLQMLSLWVLPTKQINIGSLNEYLDTHAADSNAARFIAELNSQGSLGMLQTIRPMLSAIRDLSNLINKNFSIWFPQDKAVKTSDQSKPTKANSIKGMQDATAQPSQAEERHYLLTLQSVIDDSYFKNLEQNDQRATESRAHPKRQSALASRGTKVPTQQVDNIGRELGKEFQEKFSKIFSKHMEDFLKDGSLKSENFQSKLKVGCEQAGVLLQLIRNLTQPQACPLIAYVVPNFSSDPNADPHLNLMKSLIEAFLEIQNNFIKDHREWVPFIPKLGNTTKPFHECLDEHFMHFDYSACLKDLEEAAYISLDANTNRTEIIINLELVAHKWAGTLFSEAERIIVVPNFKFQDQIPESLLSICHKLREVHKIKLTTDLSKVAYLESHLKNEEDVLELDQMLVLVLNHALTSRKTLTETDLLDNLMRPDMKKLLPTNVRQGMSLGHLEAVRRQLLLSTYDGVYKQLREIPEFKKSFYDNALSVPQDKPEMQEIRRTPDLRERLRLVRICADEVKIFCATLVNHTNVTKVMEESSLVVEAVIERVEELDVPDLLNELSRWFHIEPKTTLVSLYKLVDKLQAGVDEDDD